MMSPRSGAPCVWCCAPTGTTSPKLRPVRRLATRSRPPTSIDLVRVLAQQVGRVITHGYLLRSVMGRGYEDATGSLRVHLASLRKKLEADPSRPRIIMTEPGIGYRLHVD